LRSVVVLSGQAIPAAIVLLIRAVKSPVIHLAYHRHPLCYSNVINGMDGQDITEEKYLALLALNDKEHLSK